MADLKWSLYENGLDSIRHAIEHYTSDPDELRRYKYSIIHLSQGVTLLLKERLRREHPNFIFVNVSEETKTVDIEMALSRLKKVAKVKLDYQEEKTIKELAELRNAIEHFAVNLSKQQADSIIGRVVPFLVSFTRNELGVDIQYEIGQDHWKNLLLVQEYLDTAKREITAHLKAQNAPTFFCDRCQANTATITSRQVKEPNEWVINYDEITCLLCSTRTYKEACRGCGKVMFTQDSAALHWHSYCADCCSRLEQEYPGFRVPAYVSEVKRWFKKNNTITGEQLLALLTNVALFGSSRFGPLNELVVHGVIDFVYDEERQDFESRTGPTGGIRLHNTFKWAYDNH